jgi:hypothetical protein
MNKMNIPRILRAITWISIPVFVVSVAGWLLLNNADQADLPGWLMELSATLLSALDIVAGVSFVLMLTAYNFSFFFDWAVNGLLRRFGASATGTIIARHNTGIRVGKLSHMWRVTLRVQPVDGAPFEAITEDVGSGGAVGAQVSVRYNPLTKAVAIVRPWEK